MSTNRVSFSIFLLAERLVLVLTVLIAVIRQEYSSNGTIINIIARREGGCYIHRYFIHVTRASCGESSVFST